MARKSIYDKNVKIKIKKSQKNNDKKRRLFKFMLKNKGKYFTQRELADKLKFSTTTVNRIIHEMLNQDFKDGENVYKIMEVTGKKYIIPSYDIGKLKRYAPDISDLDNPKIWADKSAEVINDFVVLYKVNTRLAHIPEQYIKEKYGNHINVILRDKENMYIIFNNTSDKENLNKIRRELIDIYGGQQ